jgi:hypothetical protein
LQLVVAIDKGREEETMVGLVEKLNYLEQLFCHLHNGRVSYVIDSHACYGHLLAQPSRFEVINEQRTCWAN